MYLSIVKIDLSYGHLQHKQRPPKLCQKNNWRFMLLDKYYAVMSCYHVCYKNRFVFMCFYSNFLKSLYLKQLFVYIFDSKLYESAECLHLSSKLFCLHFVIQLFIYFLQISCLLHILSLLKMRTWFEKIMRNFARIVL